MILFSVRQEGDSEPGTAGGSAQGLSVSDNLLFSQGRRLTQQLWCLCPGRSLTSLSVCPAAVGPRPGPPEAGHRSRPLGGHAGDSLSHPETSEGERSEAPEYSPASVMRLR